LEDQKTGIEYFETLMRYIFSTRADMTKEDVNEMVEKIENVYPKGGGLVMTLAEIYREEGKEEGIVEGETRTLAKTAIRLLSKKFGSLTEDTRQKIENLDKVTL
jgi:predicted transposase YdaD